MTDSPPRDPPSPFIVRALHGVRGMVPGPGRALDLAAGTGRHSEVLARAGFVVFAVDRELAALRACAARLREVPAPLLAWCADLTVSTLPRSRFDVIVVTRYLQRDLFADLAAALKPGGFLLYETFTVAQRGKGRGPTSPDHLLGPGELPTLARDLDVISYAEVDEGIDAVAQFAGRRRFA